MAIVTNDNAIVFSLFSVYDCIAPGNLSAKSTSAQLRLTFTPHALKLMPDRFDSMIYNHPSGIFLALQQINGACLSNTTKVTNILYMKVISRACRRHAKGSICKFPTKAPHIDFMIPAVRDTDIQNPFDILPMHDSKPNPQLSHC